MANCYFLFYFNDLCGIVNLSDFMAISLTPMVAKLLILGPGSCRFPLKNQRILVKLTVPTKRTDFGERQAEIAHKNQFVCWRHHRDSVADLKATHSESGKAT